MTLSVFSINIISFISLSGCKVTFSNKSFMIFCYISNYLLNIFFCINNNRHILYIRIIADREFRADNFISLSAKNLCLSSCFLLVAACPQLLSFFNSPTEDFLLNLLQTVDECRLSFHSRNSPGKLPLFILSML